MKKMIDSKYVLFLLFFLFYGEVRGQVDVITADCLKAQVGSYVAFSGVKCSSGVTYAGNTARDGASIQMGVENGISRGIAVTSSEQMAKSIRIDWGKNGTGKEGSVSVYGNYSAYDEKIFSGTKPSDSWGMLLKTIPVGDNSTYDLSAAEVKFIGIRSEQRTVYINAVHLEWTKAFRNIAFEKSLYEVVWGDSFVSPQLPMSGAIYSSSDSGVATVDPVTGKVSVAGCGTTTISASFEETDKYQAETISYTLMVNPKQGILSKFDFSDYSSLFPGYSENEPLPDVVHLVLGDAELKITKGKQNPCIHIEGKKTGLHLSEGTLVEVRVPAGHKLSKVVLAHWSCSLSGLGVKRTDAIETTTYQVVDPSGIIAGYLEMDYVGTYKLKIGKSGLATFAGACAYVLPEGLLGGTVAVDEQERTVNVNYCVHPGDVVAAGEPLILKGAPGEYTLLPTAEPGFSYEGADQRLRAALSSAVIPAPASCSLYILSMKNEMLGFYWQTGSLEGDAVRNISHKAYLEMPVATGGAVQGFRLNLGETTGLEDLHVSTLESAEIYTLAGVRVNLPEHALPRGIYIIKGKKVYIK